MFSVRLAASLLSLTATFFISGCENDAAESINYPEDAFWNCIDGHVTVQYTVGENYKPVDFVILESNPEGVFDQATIDALKDFEAPYEPGSVVTHTSEWSREGTYCDELREQT